MPVSAALDARMKDFGVTSELPTIATGRTLRCVLQSSGILRFTASVTNLFCLVRREGAKPVMRASERAHWKRLGHRRRTPVSLAAHASCTEEQRLSSQQRAPSRSRSAAMHRLMRLVTLPTYTHTHTQTQTQTQTHRPMSEPYGTVAVTCIGPMHQSLSAC